MRRSTERWLVVVLLFVTAAYAIAEEVTLTTYYPSPRGVYEDLRATGTVGIGTMTPQAELDVKGLAVMGDTAVAGGMLTLRGGPTEGGQLILNRTGDALTSERPDSWSLDNDSVGNFRIFSGSSTFNNAVEAIIITPVGHVGIGTTTPRRRLQIGDDVAGLGLEPADVSPNAGYLRFGNNSGWKLHFGRSRETVIGGLNTGTTGTLMTLQDDGNLGIGTTNPQDLLHLSAPSGNKGIRIESGAAATDRSAIRFFASGTERAWIATQNDTGRFYIGNPTVNDAFNIVGGNVGIGTPSPDPGFKLDVAGKILTRDELTVDFPLAPGLTRINDGSITVWFDANGNGVNEADESTAIGGLGIDTPRYRCPVSSLISVVDGVTMRGNPDNNCSDCSGVGDGTWVRTGTTTLSDFCFVICTHFRSICNSGS